MRCRRGIWLLTLAPLFGQLAPGLIGRFGDGAANVSFLARAPHFYLDANESIHPLLRPAFRGRWEGAIQLLTAGEYEFRPAVILDGKEGTAHKLSAGMHVLSIPFVRSPGPAQLRVEWRSADFDWEPLPRAILFHQPSDAPPREYEEGLRLIVEARCANCHPAAGLERRAPPLAGIGSYVNHGWLLAFLPTHGAGTSSPDVAAFLAADKSSSPPKPRRANEVAIGKGGELFGTMGCVFCHPSGAFTDLGSKYSLHALTAVLLQFHQPSVLLDETDATALAAYLTRGGRPLPVTPGNAARGQSLLAPLGCTGCHQMTRDAVPLARLRSPECKAVRTEWAPPQQASVAAFLRQNAAANTPAPVFQLPAALERHQCLACHKTGTDAPELDGAGAKLKTDWIAKVLSGKQRIRPGRELRMPHYAEEEVRGLAVALTKAEGLAPGDGAPPPPVTAADRDIGVGLLGTNINKQGMACIGCHDWGKFKALGEEGPQLQNAAQRLRFDWYARWMRNPARILSGTSMPSYFRQMPLERARQRLNGLWAAMSTADAALVPDGFQVADLGASAEAKPVAGKDAVVIRWDMPDASPAAIAVGLPGGVSYCFDAGAVQLLYAWRGGFVDLTGTLLRKTDEKKLTPTAAIVGTIFWRAGKEPGRRVFKGYRLVDGIPEFHYLVDGVDVRETLTVEADGLRRRRFFAGKPAVEEVLR